VLNSQLNESMSLQKASFRSASEVVLGLSEERRLLAKVSLGDIDKVELSVVVFSVVEFSVVELSDVELSVVELSIVVISVVGGVSVLVLLRFSRVLLTAARMTGEALVSYVISEQSTSMKN